MLPKKFITDYGKFLSNSICLKLPDGLEWKLGSKTANDTVWLQNGWQQFSNHYRLKPGSLLVFRFDGNSTFQTCIFDQTCLEIQYPSNNIGKTKPDDGTMLFFFFYSIGEKDTRKKKSTWRNLR